MYSLGHQGHKCPQVSSSAPHIHNLVVTHVNGIHNVRLQYCECCEPRRASNEEQLVLAGLIPASFQRLQSAFTVEVLEDAHEDILASRKSSYDYMRKLRRRTNNSAAHTVTVSDSRRELGGVLTVEAGSISRIPLRLPLVEIYENGQAVRGLSRHTISWTGSNHHDSAMFFVSLARSQFTYRLQRHRSRNTVSYLPSSYKFFPISVSIDTSTDYF